MNKSMQPIIIKKKKKAHAHAPHGGAWKVAYADFVTAMMAFFLLLWLLGNTDEAQRKAIAGYFDDPGGSLIGPGGADMGVIQMSHPAGQTDPAVPVIRNDPPRGDILMNREGAGADVAIALDEQMVREAYDQLEMEQLEALKRQLEEELAKAESALRELRDQILIDYTELGLRIQIIDKEQRPMFDLGSPNVKPYTVRVLHALAPLLDSVPNHLSITGHTDSVSFSPGALYTNWELSADRANTARRALLDGGYPEAKMLTVQGMGDAAPFKPDAPTDAANRRIAIIVLKKSVADALLGHKGTSSQRVIQSEGRALGPARDQPAD